MGQPLPDLNSEAFRVARDIPKGYAFFLSEGHARALSSVGVDVVSVRGGYAAPKWVEYLWPMLNTAKGVTLHMTYTVLGLAASKPGHRKALLAVALNDEEEGVNGLGPLVRSLLRGAGYDLDVG